MHSYFIDDTRIQRRLWFSLHVLLYCGVAFLWPLHPVLPVVHSILLVTLSLHVYALYARDFENMTPEYAPVKIDSSKPQSIIAYDPDQEQSFWYRWHDV